MKNVAYGFVMFTCLFFWGSKLNTLFAPSKTEEKPSVYDTLTECVTIFDTSCIDIVHIDTVRFVPDFQDQVVKKGWTESEKIEFVKYVNTQQRICNADQWAVIQVMLNICKAGGWSWTEYSTKYHHEGTFFDRCRAGLVWSYTYNEDNPRDSIIMKRLELALSGRVPEVYRIPENMIAFESHRSPSWNEHVTKGLWQRSMIGLTLDHEFYYDWSKVTEHERTMWASRLKAMEELYKTNKNG